MKTSIALCTYNGEKFLKKQLDSILEQTTIVDEIVVCDDGSKDNTVSILNAYKEAHPHIFKIFINEKNLRSVKNFEKAMSLCSNEIIFLCDQDDLWIPEKVEIFLKHFKENTEISVIASNGFGINDNGEILDVITIWDVIGFLRKRNYKLDYYEILNITGNVATGATMAVKKEFLPKILPFPQIKEFHHDEWIALISSLEKKFDFLDEKTIYYREHDNQQVGGVFYKNTIKNKAGLLGLFTQNFDDKSFANYKFLLKRVANTYKKNKNLYEKADVQKDLFKQNLQHFQNLFLEMKKEMRTGHPIKSFLLDRADKITKKRQL